jgi:DnaK suppressor protein
MDASRLADIRAELEHDRSQQLELLEEHGADPYSDEVRDLQIANDGFADSAQATEERSELLAVIEGARQRLHAIEAALHRIDEGHYGTCVDCSGEIPEARLEVRPTAVRCVACATKVG